MELGNHDTMENRMSMTKAPQMPPIDPAQLKRSMDLLNGAGKTNALYRYLELLNAHMEIQVGLLQTILRSEQDASGTLTNIDNLTELFFQGMQKLKETT